MYSIVKAQRNLHNDTCDLLGLIRIFAVRWTYRAGWMRVAGMMNDCGWVDWLGWVRLWERELEWEWLWWNGVGHVWCWDSVGIALDVPIQRYSTSPISTPTSTLHQPTRPDPRPYLQPSVYYLIPRHTLPPPNQTHSHTSTQHIYPTIPTPHIIVPSKPSPILSLYDHPATKTLISPSNAHMSLGRFCCALTIEYKCKYKRL